MNYGRGAYAQPDRSSVSRYTRNVSWRSRIAIVVLTALAGLPIAGTVCAITCDSASHMAVAHHGSGPECEESAHASTVIHISGGSGDDCSTHDAGVREVATTAPERADSFTASASLIASGTQTTLESVRQIQSRFDSNDPPGTSSPPTTPLVLRV